MGTDIYFARSGERAHERGAGRVRRNYGKPCGPISSGLGEVFSSRCATEWTLMQLDSCSTGRIGPVLRTVPGIVE